MGRATDADPASTSAPDAPAPNRLWRWTAVIGVGVAIALLPRPAGIAASSWNLLVIFVAIVLGLTLQSLLGGAMVLFGVSVSVLVGS